MLAGDKKVMGKCVVGVGEGEREGGRERAKGRVNGCWGVCVLNSACSKCKNKNLGSL
jgi:hypothetical protein